MNEKRQFKTSGPAPMQSNCLAAVVGAFVAASTSWALTNAVRADEFIELTVALDDGRFYSPREFCAECNRKLGTHYVLDRIPQQQTELTALERVALALASESGLMRVSITSRKLTLWLPDHEDELVRRRQKERLERLLHIPLTEWPTDKGLHLPADFHDHKRTMLLVHGLEADSADFERPAIACRRWGVQVIAFDYPNDGPIAWSGEKLRSELNVLSDKHPTLRLMIVAHSMGALVSRYALEASDSPPRCVTDLFMLGAPNHGTNLADAQSLVEIFRAVPTGRLLSSELMRDGLGEAADDLRPGSRFLTELNARHRPAGVKYYAAIGRKSFLSNERRTQIEGELQDFFQRRGSPEDIRRTVLTKLASDELRDGNGDGAVTIESARMPQVENERLFDLNHTELFDLPGEHPDEAEVFQWMMKCIGWGKQHE